jgi:hypothetical protein
LKVASIIWCELLPASFGRKIEVQGYANLVHLNGGENYALKTHCDADPELRRRIF